MITGCYRKHNQIRPHTQSIANRFAGEANIKTGRCDGRTWKVDWHCVCRRGWQICSMWRAEPLFWWLSAWLCFALMADETGQTSKGCMFEGGSCRNHWKSLTSLPWRITFVGTLDGNYYSLIASRLFILLNCNLITSTLCFFSLHLCLYLCVHAPACLCFACVWRRCQPCCESCQRHSIKGDYVVCRCASLCLSNDCLLTFSPCLLPAGGRGGSTDQLPPVLLPLSLAEASATAPAPPSTLGPQGGASCWATSLPAVPPALHTFIHTHTVSQHSPRQRCLFLCLIHLRSLPVRSFSVLSLFEGFVLVLFSFSSDSCFPLQAVFVCLQS